MNSNGEATKLTPLSGEEEAKEAGMSERERRKAEFQVMRKIHQQVSRDHKWASLSISVGAWLFLWLMGAFLSYRFE